MSLHEWLRNIFTNWEKLTSNKKHSEHGERIRTKIFIRATELEATDIEKEINRLITKKPCQNSDILTKTIK